MAKRPARTTKERGAAPSAPRLALESTLLLHGVPKDAAMPLHRELCALARGRGAAPALVGVLAGRGVVGLSDAQLERLLRAESTPKLNTANLGLTMARGGDGATTVSATMELSCAAGVRVFSTGGIGGVHRGLAQRLDISSDLLALARFPMAVVASGVKSILDVESTREALEALGVPVIGFGTDRFPAFYQRESNAGVDARVDDVEELALLVSHELARGKGVLVVNPIPTSDELPARDWNRWLARAERDAREAKGVSGRSVTPFILSRLHQLSRGRTLSANLALVRSNVDLGARLAVALAGGRTPGAGGGRAGIRRNSGR